MGLQFLGDLLELLYAVQSPAQLFSGDMPDAEKQMQCHHVLVPKNPYNMHTCKNYIAITHTRIKTLMYTQILHQYFVVIHT